MKIKIKILISICFFIWSANANAQSVPGEIAGIITDEKGEPIVGAAVSYVRNGTTQGTTADVDGHYHLKPLDAGKYDLTFSFIGCRREIYKAVNVSSGQITSLSVKLLPDGGIIGPDYVVVGY